MNEKIRIDKYISSQRNDLSRSDVKKLLRAGRVTLNGETVRSPETKTDPSTARVCVDGEEIGYKEHVYIMLNKPQGYVCSTKKGPSPTVLELVPDNLRRKGLFPAGRLDKDTEGFVLITDDGELAHNMLSPSRHVPKTYFVRLEKPCEPQYEKIFADGMTIDGGEKCLPAEYSPDPNDQCACTLVLHEGKFHQVKRMFAAVGNKVTFLKRVRIGNLDLDENLPLGECLEIMHKDVEKLLCRKF
jgi:16S rRNA pseudouridine516 synthase